MFLIAEIPSYVGSIYKVLWLLRKIVQVAGMLWQGILEEQLFK